MFAAQASEKKKSIKSEVTILKVVIFQKKKK
jgi:hypothetical protein